MFIVQKYNKCLLNYPLKTKMLTSGFLFGLGDYIAQTKFETAPKYNFKRTANLFILGSVFAAPALHKWYYVLPKFCEKNIF